MKTAIIYCFLPFIKTSRACRIRDLGFRNANDTAGLCANEFAGIEALRQMFYSSQECKIAEPTYAIVRHEDGQTLEEALQRFREAQMLIGYLYSAPKSPPGYQDDTFLRAESWSAYTFTADDMLPAALAPISESAEGSKTTTDDTFVEGYFGLKDGTVPLWVRQGSRIPGGAELTLKFVSRS